MNTILQNRIEEAAKIYAESEVNRMDASTYSMHEKKRLKMFDGYDIEEALISFSEQILQNQWISVEEALPIIGKDGYVDVFIIIKKNKKTLTYTARFEDNKFWNIDGFGVYQGVTHWMEIPSLKGGEE